MQSREYITGHDGSHLHGPRDHSCSFAYLTAPPPLHPLAAPPPPTAFSSPRIIIYNVSMTFHHLIWNRVHVSPLPPPSSIQTRVVSPGPNSGVFVNTLHSFVQVQSQSLHFFFVCVNSRSFIQPDRFPSSVPNPMATQWEFLNIKLHQLMIKFIPFFESTIWNSSTFFRPKLVKVGRSFTRERHFHFSKSNLTKIYFQLFFKFQFQAMNSSVSKSPVLFFKY